MFLRETSHCTLGAVRSVATIIVVKSNPLHSELLCRYVSPRTEAYKGPLWRRPLQLCQGHRLVDGTRGSDTIQSTVVLLTDGSADKNDIAGVYVSIAQYKAD